MPSLIIQLQSQNGRMQVGVGAAVAVAVAVHVWSRDLPIESRMIGVIPDDEGYVPLSSW